MDELPDEVATLILSFLSAPDLSPVCVLSRRFSVLASSESLWSALLQQKVLSTVRPSLKSSKATYIAIEKGVNELITQFLRDTTEMQSALAMERQMQLANLAARLEAKRSRKARVCS